MNIPMLILTISIGLAFFALFMFMGLMNHKRERSGNRRYDFLADFPFELYKTSNPLSSFSRICFIFFELAFCLLPVTILGVDSLVGLTSMAYFLLGAEALKAILFTFILFVPASNEKPHFLLAILSFLNGSLVSFFAGLLFFQLRVDYPVFAYVFSIILWLLCLCYLLLAINPRLSTWPKMKVVEEESGAHLERPRPFVLAFSEWLSLGLEFLLFVIIGVAFAVLYILIR